jgi:biotin-(acetyl-CoA carboxylase) ligase
MMVGGVNPMNPEDEDEAVTQLLHNINAAKRNNTTEINSTSIEPWMEGTPPADENDFQERVLQNIKLHLRAFEEADLANSCVKNWNIEFLRPGEFATFTSLKKTSANSRWPK